MYEIGQFFGFRGDKVAKDPGCIPPGVSRGEKWCWMVLGLSGGGKWKKERSGKLNWSRMKGTPKINHEKWKKYVKQITCVL